jgi:hypothetical protein
VAWWCVFGDGGARTNPNWRRTIYCLVEAQSRIMTLRFIVWRRDKGVTGWCSLKSLPMRSIRCILCVAAIVAAGMSQSLAHEEQVIVVGRNAAGELVVDSDFDQPVELPVSIFPGIPGYATGELALHSTILDDPTNDFFQLSAAADFRFILLAKDPGMEVWNGTGYLGTSEVYSIGTSPFDVHPVWNLVNGTPGTEYALTLMLRDLNGVYPDSEPFVLSFTPVQIVREYQLSIQKIDARHAALLWTTNAAGWELQSAAVGSATNWDTVTNAPGVVGTNFSLSITTADTQRFFRLAKKSSTSIQGVPTRK